MGGATVHNKRRSQLPSEPASLEHAPSTTQLAEIGIDPGKINSVHPPENHFEGLQLGDNLALSNEG